MVHVLRRVRNPNCHLHYPGGAGCLGLPGVAAGDLEGAQTTCQEDEQMMPEERAALVAWQLLAPGLSIERFKG